MGKHAATSASCPARATVDNHIAGLEAEPMPPGSELRGAVLCRSPLLQSTITTATPRQPLPRTGGPRTETASPGLCRSDATEAPKRILASMFTSGGCTHGSARVLEAIAGISAWYWALAAPGVVQQAFAQGCMRALRRRQITNTESAAGCHRDLHCGAPVAADGYGRATAVG